MTPNSLCENCGFLNEDDNEFCCNCGRHLLREAITEIRTVAFPAPTAPAPTAPAPTIPVPIIPHPRPTNPAPERRNYLTIGIILAGFFAILLVSGLLIWSLASTDSTKNSGSADKSKGASKSDKVTSSDNSPSAELPNSFEKTYTGTINGARLNMNLKRDGASLSGTASTPRHTDYLSGTIESDGTFSLKARENNKKWTGSYTGRISPGGSIEDGTWTDENGLQDTSFTATED